MIATPVNYNATEQTLISIILGDANFDSKSWSDARLAALKFRIKQHYIQEQRYCCCYCRQPLYEEHSRVWDVEHVIARVTNSKFMFEPCNLAVACVECNSAKGAELVVDRERVHFPKASINYKIVHPHFDEWHEHIELEGAATYHALSPKGKFTIYHCDLFRFRERLAKINRPIRDRRFERDIGELRFAKSPDEARPIIASILERLNIEANKS